jgi:hypothetical protein
VKNSENLSEASAWSLLLRRTTLFAAAQINRLRWRGATGGILPEGYDPESIAGQAVADLLEKAGEGREAKQGRPIPKILPDQRELQWRLYRQVLRIINRLYHRKERLLLRNAEELNQVFTDDGDVVPYIETVPAPDPSPLDAAIYHEQDVEFRRFETNFQTFLGPDTALSQTFEAFCDGIHQPRIIAQRLNVSPKTINNLQKRIRRKAVEFCKTHPSPID